MTLDELTKKLQDWRKQKKTVSERIPEAYWQEAIKLANKSKKISMVASKLGMNANDLKKRMGIIGKKRKYSKKVKFQEILPKGPELRIPIVELTTAQGLTLKVYQ